MLVVAAVRPGPQSPRLSIPTHLSNFLCSLPDAVAQQWLSQVNLHGNPEEHLVYNCQIITKRPSDGEL